MLMYKVKTKSNVCLYKDLCECPFIGEIVEKPEEFEITELYLDRNGKVQIKQPISTDYMKEIYDFFLAYQKMVVFEDEPILATLKYESGSLVGKYTLKYLSDVHTMVAKFACMRPREIPLASKFDLPHLRLDHPKGETKKLRCDAENFAGRVCGRMSSIGQLDFSEMRLMDYLPGKTIMEQEMLFRLDSLLPQWRQEGYNVINVGNKCCDVGINWATWENTECFIPYAIRFGDQRYDLHLLISLE